jgi:hypothetical protein
VLHEDEGVANKEMAAKERARTGTETVTGSRTSRDPQGADRGRRPHPDRQAERRIRDKVRATAHGDAHPSASDSEAALNQSVANLGTGHCVR